MRRAVVSMLFALFVATAPITGTVTAVGSATTMSADAAANDDSLPERWTKTVGGNADDKLTTAVKVEDGYLAVGWSNSSAEDGKHDGYVAMLDRSGRTKWEKRYGGPGTDKLFDIEQVGDGYLLAGMASEDTDDAWDGWLMKINDDGAVQWQKTYGESGPDAFWTLARAGNDIVVGGWQRDTTAEAWVMKTNADGTPRWSETFETSRSGADEYVNSVFVTDSGDLLLAGTIEGSTFDPADGWVAKLDGSGDLQWEKAYGGTEFDHVHDAVSTPDGGFVLAGRTASKGAGEQDGWMFKIRANGAKQWERTYGTNKRDGFFGIHKDPDGGLVISGTKHVLGAEGADGWVIKTDDSGHKQWGKTYGEGYWDKFWPVIEGHGGGYLAIGESTSFGKTRDGWVVRLGGPAVAAIEDASENESGTTVRLDGSPVRAVTLSDSNVSGVLSVAEQTNLSALSPPGEALYAVTMTGPSALDNGTAAVEFTVQKGTVAAGVSDLRVAKQTADGWSVVSTEVVSEENGTAVISADIDGTGTLAVTAVDAPTANIGGTTVVSVGESATLNAGDSTAENGTLAGYEWSIAGQKYTGKTASVSFDAPGERTVNLTVTDETGLRDTATETLVVNDRPEATVETPDSATVGKAVELSADVTDRVGDVTVTWKFGSAKVEGESVEHSFGSPGTKTVTVVVEDEYGAKVTKEVQVEVSAQDSDAGQSGGGSEATTTADDNGGPVPGFGVGVALVALLAAALVARALGE